MIDAKEAYKLAALIGEGAKQRVQYRYKFDGSTYSVELSDLPPESVVIAIRQFGYGKDNRMFVGVRKRHVGLDEEQARLALARELLRTRDLQDTEEIYS